MDEDPNKMTWQQMVQKLLRTFVSAALVTIPAFTAANITDLPALKAVGISAAAAGVNGIILKLKEWLPWTKNPNDE